MADSLLADPKQNSLLTGGNLSLLKENQTGSLDNMAKRIQETATQTRQVSGLGTAAVIGSRGQVKTPGTTPTDTLTRHIEGLGPKFAESPQGATAKALVGNLQSDIDAKKKQAEKSATGLEQKGESSVGQLRRLDAVGQDVAAKNEKANMAWASAALVSEETVAKSEMEVSQGLADFDRIAAKIGSDLEFGLVHDLQVSAQTILASMQQTGDRILATEPEGVNSPKYQQHIGMKLRSLAIAQSMLLGNAAKIQADIDLQLAGNRTNLELGLRQSVGYNRQNRQTTLNAMAASQAQYAIQETQTMLGLEQMRINISNDLADYLASTPTFAVDLQPMIMEINELEAERAANEQAGSGGFTIRRGNSGFSGDRGF